jgi:DNA-directed RNA polymerase subunit N (RpoN/RPB10)
MIIPMCCFSCGKQIAHLWEPYLALVKDYELDTLKTTKTPEFRAMAKLKIGRECCRRMFLCQHDMYDKIN